MHKHERKIWEQHYSDVRFPFPSLSEETKSKEKKRKDQMQLSPRATDLMMAIPAFMGVSVVFFIICKISYVLNPYLLSVPVAVYSAIVYYLISQYE